MFTIKMIGKRSGRCGYQSQGGRGGEGGRGRGRAARWYIYSRATTKHKVLFIALGIHVFDYDHNVSSDQTRNALEKLVHHVRAINGYDISNALPKKKAVTIEKPEYTQDALDDTNWPLHSFMDA